MTYNFTAEYAKTGRSMCKGCKRNIANKKLRVGVQQASAEGSKSSFNTMRWYHPRARCLGELKKKPAWWEENCPAAEDWEGFDGLEESEQEALIAVVEDLCTGPKPKETKKAEKVEKPQESEGEGGEDTEGPESDEDSEALPPTKKEVAPSKAKAAETKPAPKKPASKKDDTAQTKKAAPVEEDTGSDEGSESQSENEDDKGDGGPRAASESESAEGADGGRSSASDDDEGDGEEEEKPKAKKPAAKPKAPASKKRAKRDYDSASSKSGSDAESDESPRKKKKSKPAPKKSSAKGKKSTTEYSAESLDDDTVKKINSVVEKFASKTLPVLKEMLKKNNQKISGTKAEILERIAEGSVLGALPKCEECGASLRFDKDSGIYSCPGKYEDGHLQRCSFTSDSVERIPWR